MGLQENARQSLMGRFPGLRGQVPIAQTTLGEPKSNTQTGPGAFQPLRIGSGAEDPVERALLDAGVDVANPPPDFKNIPLTPAEQRQFQQAAYRERHRDELNRKRREKYRRQKGANASSAAEGRQMRQEGQETAPHRPSVDNH